MMDAMKKGVSESVWVWIAGSIIVALFCLVLAYQLIVWIAMDMEAKQDIREYSSLGSELSISCSAGYGNYAMHDLLFSEQVRAIYISEERSGPPEKIWQNIAEEDEASGRWFCLQLKTENFPRCMEMYCNVTFPYMGALEYDDFFTRLGQLLGQKVGHKYRLDIRNVEGGVVVESARRI